MWHEDCRFAERVNFWRDILPDGLEGDLTGRVVGERVRRAYPPGALTAPRDESLVRSIPESAFDASLGGEIRLAPDVGRFFPQGLLHALPGVFKASRRPFRCIGHDGRELRVDLNHPLAGVPLELEVEVVAVQAHPHRHDMGGRATDWAAVLTDGPGIQARYRGRPTAFLHSGALARQDEGDDTAFYDPARMTAHLDARARHELAARHACLLDDGVAVLDLMSSLHSHLPQARSFASVTGLGMNRDEMLANPRLTDHRVHDLNRDPRLPFADASFDAVLCTVSADYLTRPLEVFRDVARVLRREGVFVVTISDRWFPPKVVRIWRELHPFERLGLVLEYFHAAEAFEDLATWTLQGLPRPADDVHVAQTPLSDPLFMAWGTRR